MNEIVDIGVRGGGVTGRAPILVALDGRIREQLYGIGIPAETLAARFGLSPAAFRRYAADGGWPAGLGYRVFAYLRAIRRTAITIEPVPGVEAEVEWLPDQRLPDQREDEVIVPRSLVEALRDLCNDVLRGGDQ